MPAAEPKVAVVIATRDRRAALEAVLPRLLALPERPRVVVADNASTDGTPHAVARFPGVVLLPLGENRGAAARTAGARAVRTPYVAFSDDDSWWRPAPWPAPPSCSRRTPGSPWWRPASWSGPRRRPTPPAC